MESTPRSRATALAFLQQFGQIDLVKRTADMAANGLIHAERTSSGYAFTCAPHTLAQHIDTLEFSSLQQFDSWASTDIAASYNGWTLLDFTHTNDIANAPGAFLGRRSTPLEHWRRDDIDDLMLPLLRPWNSGRGMMIAYDAQPEVDEHFLAESWEFLEQCRAEVGLHPDLELEGVSNSIIMAVAGVIISIHMKHIRFCLLARKQNMPVSLQQSFTIWSPEDELIQGIADWSSLPHDQVKRAIGLLTLRASESSLLESQPLVPIPLLISLNNNTLVRPVGSLGRNPMIATSGLWHARDPKVQHVVQEHREDWQRQDLYAMFQGRRYVRVDGSVRLRDESGRTTTDVDAAILDTTSGDLALFQLKWQDTLSNDVRSLRSRASNLVKQIDDWAERVGRWLDGCSMDQVMTSFRLSASRREYVRAIGLFAVSQSLARADAFGFAFENQSVATANMPQLMRVRREVGPVPDVFPRMHSVLRLEATRAIESTPIRTTMEVAGRTLVYHDLWRAFPDTFDEDAEPQTTG
tara:strand:+ start:808 stop:2376 length:1569 start_codon:yes stop_codon:yes gene_type:complete